MNDGPLSLPGDAPVTVESGLAALMMGADAETELVRGVLAHRLRLSGRALRAATFLQAYGLTAELNTILVLRRHLGSSRELVQAIDAVALKKFMSRIQVNLGQ